MIKKVKQRYLSRLKAVPGQHVEDLAEKIPEACHKSDSNMANKKVKIIKRNKNERPQIIL